MVWGTSTKAKEKKKKKGEEKFRAMASTQGLKTIKAFKGLVRKGGHERRAGKGREEVHMGRQRVKTIKSGAAKGKLGITGEGGGVAWFAGGRKGRRASESGGSVEDVPTRCG